MNEKGNKALMDAAKRTDICTVCPFLAAPAADKGQPYDGGQVPSKALGW